MIEIQAKDIVKSFEVGNPVLKGLTFQIESGERVGLLGRNGAGKSTLFKILTGELDYDTGQLTIAPGQRAGLISQIPVYPDPFTVEDVLRTAFGRLERLSEEMRALERRMEDSDITPALLRRYDTLSERFARFGGYDTDVAVNKIVNGLSIPEAQRRQLFRNLSGGEKTRVNLARLILEDTDILLLDEPTNHLDLHATEWLETYLESFRGTVLVISHDRYFLDRTVRRILELDAGKVVSYAGNYSAYAVERDRRALEQARRYKKEQAEIERLSETARKMHEHNTELLHKRAFSIEKRIERMRTVSRPVQRRKLDARFNAAEFHGDEILSFRNLSMSYGEKRLFSEISLKIEGGERIALIGDNGVGKSTLLKIIMGEEYPDAGRVRIGPQTRISYLPQVMAFDNPAATLLDTMLSAKRNLSAQSARNRLAAYDFTGEDVFKPVCVLSGGEQSRLRLCMLMDDETNLLILDEPTNHLDIASREWIEDAVEAYDGALLFVSHDRYFINRFATRIWELSDGTISDYPMGFTQYRAMKAQEDAQKEAEQAVKTRERKAGKPVRGGKQQQSAKRQLTICERDIARLEERLAALDASMEEVSTDYEKLTELSVQREAVQAELDTLYERWETLSEEAEA
ncbi:MAG: ABC-F family ATP-binding cassette domain-containing protein [Oscillibacter sp.]|nr:ABC-F family ATP-binding cassette domain-containing protein [Oscillibacter sp.]